MASAHVQSTGAQSSGAVASQSATFGSNTTGGNLILVGISSYRLGSSTAATFTVTDNKGNTYAAVSGTRQTANDGGNGWCSEIFIATGISGGASHQITVTPNVTAFVTLGASEISGADSVDKSAVGTGTSTTPATASMTLAASSDFVFGVMTHLGTGTVSITEGSGYTLGYENENTTNMDIGTEYKAGASGSQTPSWTIGSSAIWVASGLSLNQSSGTPATLPQLDRGCRGLNRGLNRGLHAPGRLW